MIVYTMVKRLLASLILFFVVAQSLLLPSIANAGVNTQWWAPSYDEFSTKVNDDTIPDNEIFGERYTHAQTWWVIYSIIAFIIEQEIAECAATANASDPGDAAAAALLFFTECQVADPINTRPTGNNMGAGASLGIILDLFRYSDSMIANKPASGVQYVASKLENIGIISPAYAQNPGFGFNTLSPIEPLWAASRNAAYALMTVAVVILAFLVMFRARISPQASVTIQSAIPRVIIGLLLVTFSFAIAGFVIDLAYVVIGLVSALVSSSSLSDADVLVVFGLINQIGVGLFSLGLAVILGLLVPIVVAGAAVGAGIALPFALPIVGPLGTGAIVAAVLLIILVLLILIVAAIRIFWLFLRTYVMMILLILALPFGALGYIVSTGQNPFTTMLRSLIAQASVFVTATLVIMLAHIIFWGLGAMYAINTWDFVNVYEIVPAGGTAEGVVGLPGFSGVNNSILGFFAGIVVLLMVPGVATGVREWIRTGRYNPDRGSGPAAGLAVVGGLAGAAAGYYTGGIGKGTLGRQIVEQEARVNTARNSGDEAEYTKELSRLKQLQNRSNVITGAAKTLGNRLRG